MVTWTCNTWPDSRADGYTTFFRPQDVPFFPGLSNRNIPQTVLGVVMYFASPGTIRAIRFIKGDAERGTGHTCKVYDANRQLLAQTGGFNDQRCTDGQWVVARLNPPLAVEASTKYTFAVDSMASFVGTDRYYPRPRKRGRILSPTAAGVYGRPNECPMLTEVTYNYWIDGEPHASPC
jgi:hypothetical protein